MIPVSYAPRLTLLAALVATLALADPPDDRTHTLFMGADLAVGLNHHMYPVSNVEGSSWVILKDGEAISIPTRTAALDIKITPLLKLTEKSATVADLRAERGYTFANDPMVRQGRALADSATANTGYAAATNQANAKADNYLQQQDTGTFRSGGVLAASTIPENPAIPVSFRQFTPATPAEVVEENYVRTTAGADNETTAERNSTGFDAMDVTFDVSSDRLLQNPYVVTVTRFQSHGAPPGVVQNLVYAKALDPIDSHPLHVHLNEGGFPPGFEPVGFQLHVYNRGEEIATTVADKRVVLTRDEAFEYVRTSYEGSHLHDTLPAVPAMGHVSSDLPARLGQGQYAATIYVRVSKDGMPETVYRDGACTQPLDDPYVDALVRGLRFEPALAKGMPVAGVAAFKLRQLLTF